MLRLLKADVESPASSISQEKSAHEAVPGIIYHDSQREIRSALLNAERQKAEVLMEYQKRRYIC